MTLKFLWPREHGAWAMLLFPFFGALVVGGAIRWESLAALVVILAVFLAQEPILVLLRQRWLWKERREAADRAVFSLLMAGTAGVVAGSLLLWRLPSVPLAFLALAALGLLVSRVVLSLGNLQRSTLLQVAEATGLSATSLLGYLSALGRLELTAILLWALFSLHHTAALFVIRARLEAIVSLKSQDRGRRGYRTAGWAGQSLLLAVLVAAVISKAPVLATALAVPFVFHTRDLLRLDDPLFLRTPLVHVGWREVGISAGFSALAVSSFLL